MEIKNHLQSVDAIVKYYTQLEKLNTSGHLEEADFNSIGLFETENYQVITLVHRVRGRMMSIRRSHKDNLKAMAEMELTELKKFIDEINPEEIKQFLSIHKKLTTLGDHTYTKYKS